MIRIVAGTPLVTNKPSLPLTGIGVRWPIRYSEAPDYGLTPRADKHILRTLTIKLGLTQINFMHLKFKSDLMHNNLTCIAIYG